MNGIHLLFSLLSFINQVSLRKLQYIFFYIQANLPYPYPNKKSATQNHSQMLFQSDSLILVTAPNHCLNGGVCTFFFISGAFRTAPQVSVAMNTGPSAHGMFEKHETHDTPFFLER